MDNSRTGRKEIEERVGVQYRVRWEGDIKVGLREIGCENVDWIQRSGRLL
jgi:hypothetical protein